MSAVEHLQGAQFGFDTSRAPSSLPTDTPRPSADDYNVEAYRNRPIDTGPHVLSPTGMSHTVKAPPSYSRRVVSSSAPNPRP